MEIKNETSECLESVVRNDYPNYQVIVVDNNSPNNSMECIKAWDEGKLDVWIKQDDHLLRRLSFPPAKKLIPYVYYSREEAERGGNRDLENSLIVGSLKSKKETNQPISQPTIHPLLKTMSGQGIDILLATYNGEEYLGEQLNSILNQTYENWQLIVRDDGSTDGTVEIIKNKETQRFVVSCP